MRPLDGDSMVRMGWLARHGWMLLFGVALTMVIFGVTDIVAGAGADPAIARALTGMTLAELEAESAAAYGLYDFMTRVNGWSLVLIGALLAVIVFIPFRRGGRWAWLAAWALPLWAAGVPLFYIGTGLAAGEAPPPPMISGPIVAIFSAGLLLATRPHPAEAT